MRNIILMCLFAMAHATFLANDFEDSDVVYLKNHTHVSIEILGAKLNIKEHHEVEKLFKRNFEENAKENIYFSEFDKIILLEAASFLPGQNSKKGIKVKNFGTSDVMERGIFYSGYKSTHFVYPQLSKDVVGKLKYTKYVKDPHFIKPFYFQDSDPVLHAKYSVTFPKQLKLKPLLFGAHEGNVEMTEIIDKKTITWIWEAKSVKSYKHTTDAPSTTYTSPHIVLLIESYESSIGEIKVSGGISELYAWYTTLLDKIRNCDEEEIKSILSQIVTPEMNKQEAQKAVYNWVQDNIKYIAFEDGMAGFVPRSACDVLNKRYGDCKDMANLLYSFYKVMGVDAHIAWIGTRKKPYTYEELPSTVADNHMICAITENDTTLFLDATNPFSAFGMPTSMIQGKEALLAINDKEYKVAKVPEISAASNVRVDHIQCKLDGKNIIGELSTKVEGYAKEEYQIRNYRAEMSHDKDALKDFIAFGTKSTEVSNDSISGFSNLSQNGEIALDFKMPNYARKVSDRYYVNLNFYKQEVNEKLDEESRLVPFEKEYKKTVVSKVVLEIPEGFAVSFVPEKKSIQNQYGSIETSYEIKEGEVVYSKKFVSNFLLMQPESFAVWNKFMQTVSEINHENIILKATL
ncbi:DUF3857 domain-containing protein [Flammeovirga sp. EKP202]|uniref:transglutaminase domain-containing protein n=1 Tax=Flammeovirga sp. EKP202 TaxID=2770592 RepID=UPI00165F75A2|nr:DUF3857 domain-containing protein [Flammeovirga sp. EKP202]MBD0405034.1 DUF3857 domain-containing protein [Flammeovirga sp. EKP202]